MLMAKCINKEENINKLVEDYNVDIKDAEN